jgi:hypothetical protein
MSARVNPWGLAACILGGAALLQASVGEMRLLSITLAACGLAVVIFGALATLDGLRSRDRLWLGLGFTLNGILLVLALFAPSVLNAYWGTDAPLARTDTSRQVLVAWDQPQQVLRLTAESADARTEALRQYDVLIRLASVKLGPPPEGPQSAATARSLRVHLQILNLGRDTRLGFAGFGNGPYRPVLTGVGGQTYPVVAQRRGQFAKGEVVFETSSRPGMLYVLPKERADVLLVFTAPLAPREALRLELPAAAWGRQGTCCLRIPELFDSAPVQPNSRKTAPAAPSR